MTRRDGAARTWQRRGGSQFATRKPPRRWKDRREERKEKGDESREKRHERMKIKTYSRKERKKREEKREEKREKKVWKSKETYGPPPKPSSFGLHKVLR